MSFYIESETDKTLPLPCEELLSLVTEAVLTQEGCPYEAEVNLLLTDNEGIREINAEQRGIDAPTDVLSFPMAVFDTPADFDSLEEQEDCFHPESGELLLGDIVISVEKVMEQASAYGHSLKREFSFLIAHSMLHLIGYDHERGEEAEIMEYKQNQILDGLGIGRFQDR